MKFHPDVNKSPDASEKFIEICNAYEMLSGKGGNAGAASSGGQNSSRASSSTSSSWEPPHRRKSTYSSNSRSQSSSSSEGAGSSTDWRDYMNIKDDEDYDNGGDSFGSIFSDLFTGVAAAAAGYKGNGGVLEDLISFLEGNVDGFASDAGYDQDPDLLDLLSQGSIEEIRAELEDATLLVKQLETKYDGIKKDIASVTNELELNIKNASKKRSSEVFRQDEELNEQLVSLQARQKVVMGYMKKANKRLDLLQERLIEIRGRNRSDQSSFSNSRSYSVDNRTSNYSSSSPSSAPSSTSSYSSSSSATDPTTTNARSTSRGRDSFGTSGRGRSRSRSRARVRNNSNEGTRQEPAPSATDSTNSQSTPNKRSPITTSQDPYNYIPPHRRTDRGSYEDDKKRLR